MTPALELRNIRKRYGPTTALAGADLVVQPGELHALLGENGAGKTTLMRIAYGLERADAGTVAVYGRRVPIRSPREARRLGIGMVHQHPTSIPSLTVAENIALAAGWPVEPAEIRRRVLEQGEATGLDLDPDAYAGRLPIALRQRLELRKALAAEARILLLDEPTAALAPKDADDLLDMLRRYIAAGNSAVLITHKLSEAISAASQVTVLRRGEVTYEGSAATETPETLARAMIGPGVEAVAEQTDVPGTGGGIASTPAGATVVRLQSLDIARDGRYGIAVRGASLTVREGEIVGIAAVEGNGQRELLRAIAGILHPFRGMMEVAGPVGFVPEDRTTEGLIPSLSLTGNVVLGMGGAAPGVHGHRIDWDEAESVTRELVERFRIRAAGAAAPAASLSGGNQQKLVLARALAGNPRVIVAENPTRGLDLAAAADVHRRLREAAAAGAAVLLYSTDLDEVLAASDRIVVMSDGQVREAPGRDRDVIGQMMVGVA